MRHAVSSLVAIVAMTALIAGCGQGEKTGSPDRESSSSTDVSGTSSPQPSSSDEGSTTKEDSQNMNITVTVKGTDFRAQLADNETARAFRNRLPLTLSMEDMNSNEKFHYLDESLPNNPSRVNEIANGDLMLFGSDCVVLFYEAFDTSFSYTRIGQVIDPERLAATLGRGSANVSFRVS